MTEYMFVDTSLNFKWLMEKRLLTSCFEDCINLIGVSASDLRKKMIKVVQLYFS